MMDKGITILERDYSVNIKKDYNNDYKINSYIPTTGRIKALNKLIYEIGKGNGGSYLISGAYGTGKSYFISVLLNLLSKKTEGRLERLKENIEKVYDIEELFKEVDEKKYLVVFPEEGTKGFSESLIVGIKQALEKENITITLNTEFDGVLRRIINWKENYYEIYEKLESKLEKKNLNIEIFIEKIEKNNSKYLEVFKEIYSEIFAGEEYLDFKSDKNIGEILENFEYEIKKKTRYNGILYIFDEFGRYLEKNIKKIDVKEIQDVAEYCNGNNDSNIILITHKDIFQYTNLLNKKDAINEWEKVSGRFQKEHLSYEKSTALDIIANSFYKNENFGRFKEKNIEKFNIYINNLGRFLGDSKEKNIIMEKYYPLNYLTAYILADFSQKIAQNERTVFAFLSSKESKALRNILNKDFTIGLDRIYDYFRDNFKYLDANSSEYKIYLNTEELLGRVQNKVEKKLIKTLGCIYIYNNFNDLQPTAENIALSLDLTLEETMKILEELKENNIILYKKYLDNYKLVEDRDVNIEREIETYIKTKLKNIDYSLLMNKYMEDDIFYPLEYNEKYDITRYLRKYYVDFSNMNILEKLDEKFADGNIIYFTNILKKDGYEEVINCLRETSDILVINKENDNLDIKNILEELQGIENLIITEEKYKKESLRKEINVYKEELIGLLNESLEEYFANKKIYVNGNLEKENNLFILTREFLEKKYDKYIHLNYELINKNILSIPMKKVRSEIIDKILNNYKWNEEEFYGTSAISSLERIGLLKQGFIRNKEEIIFSEKYMEIFNKILVNLRKEEVSFKDIYEEYCTKKGSYGFRKGYFTLVLGIFLSLNLKDVGILLKEGKIYQKFSGVLLDRIEKNPEEYILIDISLTKEQFNYLEDLEELFKPYIVNKSENKGENILEGIRSYLYSLPRLAIGEYIKETKILSKIYNGIFQEKNSIKFFLEEIGKRSKVVNYKEIVEVLKEDYIYIQQKIFNLEDRILTKVNEKLGESKNLEDNLQKWKQLNISIENNFENWLKNYVYINNKQFLNDVTEKIVGFDYTNWTTENNMIKFEEKISELLKKKDEKISIELRKEVIKRTQMGKLLEKKLLADIKNMGTSVSEEEKREILLEILNIL